MRSKINWLWYWYVTRRFNKERAAWFVARHLPKRVQYWVCVVAACKAEPNGNPSDVKVLEMMQAVAPAER